MRPLILALGLLASVHAQAESLANLLERAWQRLPQAQSQAVRESGLDAGRAAAASLFPGPATIALGHQTDRLGRDAGARELEAELSVPLWLPGEKAASRQLAASESTLFNVEQAALRLHLAGQLREAIWQRELAENAATLARGRLEAYRQIETDVARRVKAGELARADLLLARGETIAAQATLTEAEQALFAAHQDYLQLVGENTLPSQFAEGSSGSRDNEAHPLLALSRKRLESAQARAQLVAKTGREHPEFAVTARRERGDAAERYGNTLAVAIRIPLGSDARNAPRVAIAQAELTEAEVAYRRQRFDIEQGVRKAEAEARSAALRAELAESRHALARENLQLMKTAFSLGEKSLFEFQRVQSALDEAALAASQAAIELNRAHARLNQTNGVLP